MNLEDKKLFEDDKEYFERADENKDGKLNREEFSAFQNPELYPVMYDILIKVWICVVF